LLSITYELLRDGLTEDLSPCLWHRAVAPFQAPKLLWGAAVVVVTGDVCGQCWAALGAGGSPI